MAEEAIMQAVRRCRERTAELLDDESFNVAEARGKLAQYADFTCFDKGGLKIVRSCYLNISKKELEEFLYFNDSQVQANTILQLFVWSKKSQKPKRFKLFYNQPDQRIPDDLLKLVK